jgi:hypothetical protein
MKTKLPYILVLVLCLDANAQAGGGLENYYYMKGQNGASMVPILYYATSSNWYGEARYNYDDDRTFSLYGGKTFSKSGTWSYSATPLVGGMVGLMNGGSLGLNLDVDRGKFFLSSQSQYSFSFRDEMNKYFFTWSEIGFKPYKWCYTGVALQQTSMYREAGQWETGYMLGFSAKNWTIPFYVFSVSSQQRYFILGINWEWTNTKKKKSKNSSPALYAAEETKNL